MKFTQDEIKKRRISRLAEIIYDHWEEGSGMDTRFFDHPFIHDEYVINGQSHEDATYREHIVPRVYLRDRCLEMFEYGASIEEVSKAIFLHLRIVKITPEQAKEINKMFRDSMPDGWTFGKSDPLERLNIVGIEIA